MSPILILLGLSSRNLATRRVRTLDALQLAVALDLCRRNLLDTFVVEDKLLADVAALDGLVIENHQDTP